MTKNNGGTIEQNVFSLVAYTELFVSLAFLQNNSLDLIGQLAELLLITTLTL